MPGTRSGMTGVMGRWHDDTCKLTGRLGPGDHAARVRLRAAKHDAAIEHVLELEDEDVRDRHAAPTLRLAQVEELLHPLAVERPGRKHARKTRAREPQRGAQRERRVMPL